MALKLTLVFTFASFLIFAQSKSYDRIGFFFDVNSSQKFGLDTTTFPFSKNIYDDINNVIDFSIDYKRYNINSIQFRIDGINIPFTINSKSTGTIFLPKNPTTYKLIVLYNGQVINSLDCIVSATKIIKINLIPLFKSEFDKILIEKSLNRIYKSANIQFKVEIKSLFESEVVDSTTLLSVNDSLSFKYSGQMRLLRDLYFNYQTIQANSFNFFLVKGFSIESKSYAIVKGKTLGFIKQTRDYKSLILNLQNAINVGLGFDDNINNVNTRLFWEKIQNGINYSFYDNEEHVRTNNGTVAYYFWEEDNNGFIKFKNNQIFESIKKPYKKNYLSYRFGVKYKVLRPFLKIYGFYITLIDVILFCFFLLFLFIIRYKLKKVWERNKYSSNFFRRLLLIGFVLCIGMLTYQSFVFSNFVLMKFKLISGSLTELKGESYLKAKNSLLTNPKLLHQEEYSLCSEILIKRNKYWEVKKRKKVLYFDVREDSLGKFQLSYVYNSDSIHLKINKLKVKSFGHYLVYRYFNDSNKLVKEKVLNHRGIDITDQIFQNDFPKRILLFVNGYRPTSIGSTFEEKFTDIQLRGVEYPNSTNFIYDFDRYNYWQEWNQMNLLFQNRLNPHETFYADGHFSVSTSNHKSLLNFTRLSLLYPKRCKNKNQHHCFTIEKNLLKSRISYKSNTYSQLKLKANKSGFYHRYKKGRLAGRNLIQVMNDFPNKSSNDTLYLVSHSMGFAYALGMIEEIRGKINFGGFYTIAPENAKTGKINTSEWKEVYHYGSNFETKNHDAPCLLDGVAPQSKIIGLKPSNRIYIPEILYDKKGFFDSHFIGYYKWIFDIQKGEKGYIQQR